jgi:hypothetical protein
MRLSRAWVGQDSLGLFSFLRLGRGNLAARLFRRIRAGVIFFGTPRPILPNACACGLTGFSSFISLTKSVLLRDQALNFESVFWHGSFP